MEAFPAAARLVAAPAGPPGHDAAVAPAGGAPEQLKPPVAALSDPPVRAAAILAPAAGAPGPPDPLLCVLRPRAAGCRSWFIGTLAPSLPHAQFWGSMSFHPRMDEEPGEARFQGSIRAAQEMLRLPCGFGSGAGFLVGVWQGFGRSQSRSRSESPAKQVLTLAFDREKAC